MTPEQKARANIDSQLAAAGWLLQHHKTINLATGPAIAVREFPLETGPVDYLLYAGRKVIGLVEAKPEGHALKGVEIQSRKYTMGVPAKLPAWRRPPPFAYESTGTVTQFTNGLEPDARSRLYRTSGDPIRTEDRIVTRTAASTGSHFTRSGREKLLGSAGLVPSKRPFRRERARMSAQQEEDQY